VSGKGKLKAVMVDFTGTSRKVIPDWVPRELDRAGIALALHECSTEEELAAYASEADFVWVMGGGRVCRTSRLEVLQKCGAIVRTGSGTDNIDVEAATRLGIVVANTPEAIADDVADHAIGLLFAVIRLIPLQDRRVREGKWGRIMDSYRWHLKGQTLGLVGFGLIGRMVARKMSGFEMEIVACDPYTDEKAFSDLGVRKATLEEVLRSSDFLSLHCPLNDETRRLIGERQLSVMKRNAVLINAARGPLVDERALVRALQEGRIGAAGLDVFEEEPLPADSPLLKLENVVLTPHVASYSDVYEEKVWRSSVEAILDMSRGFWPRSCVNRAVRPRWALEGRPPAGASE